jgi:5-methylcytosine-specific restriction protein B
VPEGNVKTDRSVGGSVTDDYPEFRLRLPNNGPEARGWLLVEKGTNGSRKFVVAAGSPARRDVVPSFSVRAASAHALRNQLIEDEVLRDSATYPGWLETASDVECNSPSQAAAILYGRNANGWVKWKSAEGHPLVDYLDQTSWGPSRAWLVRGSNVSGLDLFPRLWLPDGTVTLAARHLRQGQGIEEGMSKDRLRTIVEEDYASTATYNQKQALVEELHAFLSRMRPGDTVCALSSGEFYVGQVTGSAEQVDSEDGRSNLRRPVEWADTGHAYENLPEELQQKLSVQRDVVDLTAVKDLIDGLGVSDEELIEEAEAAADRDPSLEIPAITARRELELPEPDEALAKDLLVHDAAWLREVRDLLWDERQLIFYGPPGTGKTYLSLKLAEFLGGGPEQVKLVQFHPSYAYEDFFEGFRPQEDPETREVAFRLTAGPLRELADLASREGNRHVPHFLIIDEINRANLAKVFGELYFLLEYRNQTVRLTYSGDDFSLPRNLFVIGTMNTADRSIALVDAAMRRRFAFVELSPRAEPTRGLLRRWLAKNGKEPEPAELLEALNARIGDPDFQIGPSYLMKPGVYRDGGLERTWRTKILPLLEEHHFGEGVDVEQRYGLAALRAAR